MAHQLHHAVAGVCGIPDQHAAVQPALPCHTSHCAAAPTGLHRASVLQQGWLAAARTCAASVLGLAATCVAAVLGLLLLASTAGAAGSLVPPSGTTCSSASQPASDAAGTASSQPAAAAAAAAAWSSPLPAAVAKLIADSTAQCWCRLRGCALLHSRGSPVSAAAAPSQRTAAARACWAPLAAGPSNCWLPACTFSTSLATSSGAVAPARPTCCRSHPPVPCCAPGAEPSAAACWPGCPAVSRSQLGAATRPRAGVLAGAAAPCAAVCTG